MMKHIKLLFSKEKGFYNDIKQVTGSMPGNINLYKKALRHRSASIVDDNGRKINNERLEFLGDAILDSLIAEYLFSNYPNENEGNLTKLRAKIVNREFINDLAFKLGLDKLVVTNISESSVTLLYGDAFEAFIGAVFLDKGYKGARKFVFEKVIKPFVNIEQIRKVESNYKSLLIEWVQKRKLNLEFQTTENTGQQSSHFKSIVTIDRVLYGKGYGESKKMAEQDASKLALEKINKEGENL
ncbi:MAG: ribonuclease III [Bacteroidales bacterium]|nr:ribonuclease III [Bacteroidales bacterium]